MSSDSAADRWSIWLTSSSIMAMDQAISRMSVRHSGHDPRTMETSAGHLRVRGRLEDETASFTLDGDVDLNSSQAVRDAVCGGVDEGAHEIVLDLAGVGFLDSSGLNGLLNTARDVHRRG